MSSSPNVATTHCDDIQFELDRLSESYEQLGKHQATLSNDLKVCREDRLELKTRMADECQLMIEKALGEEMTKTPSRSIDLNAYYPTRVLCDLAEPLVDPLHQAWDVSKENFMLAEEMISDLLHNQVIPAGSELLWTTKDALEQAYAEHVDPLISKAEEQVGYSRSDFREHRRSLQAMTEPYTTQAMDIAVQSGNILASAPIQSKLMVRNALSDYPELKAALPSSKTDVGHSLLFCFMAFALLRAFLMAFRLSTFLLTSSVQGFVKLLVGFVHLAVSIFRLPLIILTCGQCGRRRESRPAQPDSPRYISKKEAQRMKSSSNGSKKQPLTRKRNHC